MQEIKISGRVVHLDKRIFCPRCGTQGKMWISPDDYEDNAGDLCLCIECGYEAYGLDWAESVTSEESFSCSLVEAIREQANAT